MKKKLYTLFFITVNLAYPFSFLYYSIIIFGFTIIAIDIAGIENYSNSEYKKYSNIIRFNKQLVSVWRSIVIFHSHHSEILREKGKEFKLNSKYFCTGCYGIATGIVIGNLIILLSLLNIRWVNQLNFAFSLPFYLFIPILIRYMMYQTMPSSIRFLSNMLLVIGCYLIIIKSESENFPIAINLLVWLGMGIIAFMRYKVSKIESFYLIKDSNSVH